MKNFNIHRFGHTLWWNLQTSKKELLTITTILFCIFLGLPLINMVFNIGSEKAFMDGNLQMVFGFNILVLSVFISLSGCWIFSNMKTKGQIISFKMLPASDVEKYLTRFLYATVGLIAGAVLAFILADLVRMLLYLAVYHDTFFSMTTRLFTESHICFNDDSMDNLAAYNFFAAAGTLAVHAYTILCGTLFRHHKVVFTALIGMIIGTIGGILIGSVALYLNTDINMADAEAVVWLGGVAVLCLAAAMYWLSYRLFRRMQVINNKWINV